MSTRSTSKSGTNHAAPATVPQVSDSDAIHASFYATYDPEPDMAWVVPFLDPDALDAALAETGIDPDRAVARLNEMIDRAKGGAR